MTRPVFVILLLCSCVTAWAQEQPHRSIIVRLASGDNVQYDLDDIVSIDFESEAHRSVDLGLSVRWAACNVGADAPEALGNLYAWGEVARKRDYAEENYRYYSNGEYQNIGVNICGSIQYDVARLLWGEPWRLPTRGEVRELMEKCQWVADTLNNVAGYRITGPSGRSIFLPSAGCQTGKEREEVGTGGYYWTGSLNTQMPSSAYNLNFQGYDGEWTASRAYGFSIRPVR